MEALMNGRKRVIAVAYLAFAAMSGALGQERVTLMPSSDRLTLSEAQMGQRIPQWGGNALVVAAGPSTEPNAFLAYDRKGAVVFNVSFSIPGADHTYVYQWARGASGAFGLCGSSYMNDGRGAPFIAWISPDGSSQRVIRTDPYTPTLIAVAPDGTLWTVGYELHRGFENRGGTDPGAGVLRHFDPTGKTLGAFISRSSFPDPVELYNGVIAAWAGHVGWIHYRETNGEGAYDEVSPGGEVVRYPMPRLPKLTTAAEVDGMAITDTGEVFVAMRDVGAHNGSLVFRLSRSTEQWLPVTLPGTGPSDYVELFGASGTELVFRAGSDPAFRFVAVNR
jgi:hypothetical protein